MVFFFESVYDEVEQKMNSFSAEKNFSVAPYAFLSDWVGHPHKLKPRNIDLDFFALPPQ